ncbi:MAG: sulfatase [Planctomycetes bacterium]|nr:sulfatase [Planctomycetota bacterium]
MTRPNILYLHSHDTGRTIQPYGHAVSTPNLQRLAEQGALFRQAFCAAPTCSPSRAALLTGQWAHCSGMLGLAHRGFSLRDYRQHLVHTLRGVGYFSALAGVQHVAADPAVIGYDSVLWLGRDPSVRRDPQVLASEFLDRRPPQPFFLSVGFFETHREFPPLGPTEDPRYVLPPGSLPDTPETREDMARFGASARILDSKIGVVLEALERNGLAENTLVVCTTDHGLAFPRMKCNLTDAGTGVYLILRGPGGFSGGKTFDSLVSHVDLFPTLCDLLGTPRPGWLQGVSLMPLAQGQAREVRDELFAEVTYHAAYEPQRCVRTGRWKYIRRFGDRARPVLPNCDDGPSKSVWLAHGWRERQEEPESLYDLVFDPQEARNLIHSPGWDEAAVQMRGRLDRWMRATGDPILRGPVPAPAGAVVNLVDGLSPSEKPRPAS